MPAQFMPLRKNAQDLCTVALLKSGRYSFVVAAKSATGFGDPSSCRRTGAPITIAGAFFVPASLFYGGCAWETFGSAGVLYARFANPRTAATPLFGDERWLMHLTIGLSSCRTLPTSR